MCALVNGGRELLDEVIVVCDHDDSCALLGQLVEDGHGLIAGFCILISSGFISQDETRRVQNGTGNADSLLLAARKFVWHLLQLVFQTNRQLDHVGVQTFGEKKVKMGVTAVPYRALLPKGADNLIVAGRCIGADGQAMGPCRIMSTCMATGQAAGTAAKFKLAAGCPFRAINVQALRAALRTAGSIVDP